MATPAAAVAWGRERTARVVVDVGGDRMYWAGTASAPADVTGPWPGEDALE